MLVTTDRSRLACLPLHVRQTAPATRSLRPQIVLHKCITKSGVVACQPGDFDTSREGEKSDKTLEDELRDPSNFVEYLLPRPLRVAFLVASGASCILASLLAVAQLLQGDGSSAAAINLVVDVCGAALFLGLARWDNSAAQTRIEQRRDIRQAQIRLGDREVFYDDQGEKMSRLKEVNEDWILRRLERWGRRENMPFVGPVKGAIVQQLVRERAPKVAVEVGSMAGYSALLIGQTLPPGGRLVSFEKEISWVLAAKRFVWQAGTGVSGRDGAPSLIHERVDIRWGDALTQLSSWSSQEGQIDLLFLDGVPKDTLAYLKAAEPHLAQGAVVIADNAVVFAEGGMKPYLAYVRGNPERYTSRTVETTLEWRDDVADGLEVSTYLGGA